MRKLIFVLALSTFASSGAFAREAVKEGPPLQLSNIVMSPQEAASRLISDLKGIGYRVAEDNGGAPAAPAKVAQVLEGNDEAYVCTPAGPGFACDRLALTPHAAASKTCRSQSIPGYLPPVVLRGNDAQALVFRQKPDPANSLPDMILVSTANQRNCVGVPIGEYKPGDKRSETLAAILARAVLRR